MLVLKYLYSLRVFFRSLTIIYYTQTRIREKIYGTLFVCFFKNFLYMYLFVCKYLYAIWEKMKHVYDYVCAGICKVKADKFYK